VLYGDGYESYSPRSVFEDGYTMLQPEASVVDPDSGEPSKE